MGRPKKYLTDDESKLARTETMKKYYENHRLLCALRNKQHREQHKEEMKSYNNYCRMVEAEAELKAELLKCDKDPSRTNTISQDGEENRDNLR